MFQQHAVIIKLAISDAKKRELVLVFICEHEWCVPNSGLWKSNHAYINHRRGNTKDS